MARHNVRPVRFFGKTPAKTAILSRGCNPGFDPKFNREMQYSHKHCVALSPLIHYQSGWQGTAPFHRRSVFGIGCAKDLQTLNH